MHSNKVFDYHCKPKEAKFTNISIMSTSHSSLCIKHIPIGLPVSSDVDEDGFVRQLPKTIDVSIRTTSVRCLTVNEWSFAIQTTIIPLHSIALACYAVAYLSSEYRLLHAMQCSHIHYETEMSAGPVDPLIMSAQVGSTQDEYSGFCLSAVKQICL